MLIDTLQQSVSQTATRNSWSLLFNNIQIAWQLFREEKQQAAQRFGVWTQAILMIFIVTLSQTSASIQHYLTDNLNNLLGADLVISQQPALNPEQSNWLQRQSQQMVTTQTLETTLTHNGAWHRAKLKAVAGDYPLQGQLTSSDDLGGASIGSATGPEAGEIWLDARLTAGLGITPGESLILAQRKFTFTRVLTHEPDRLMEGHTVAMRAMIHLSDMAQLDVPQDLIHHRYLFASSAQQNAEIVDWQKHNLPGAQIHYKQGAHPLALFWKRTENFVGLASIILFFMAAIAIEQLTQVQIRKEQYFSAICMSLGATKLSGLQISVVKWLLRIVFMLPLVLLVSAVAHWGFVSWLRDTFANLTWQWNMGLAIQSVLSAAGLFLIFQLPVWLSLKNSSVTRLVHNALGKASYWLSLASVIGVLVAVVFVYSDNGLLTTMVLVSMSVSVLLILAVSWFVLTFGEKLTQNFSGLMPFTLYMMKQRLLSKTTQVLGVGLCAFLLLFTLMLLRDLGGTMAAYQRQHDGNLLVSQATDKQMTDVENWASEHGIQIRQSKPYMYAKLTQINNKFLSEHMDQPSESMATMQNAIRLHWSKAVPANNQVDKGQWWSTESAQSNWQQISIEQEVMTDLQLEIGDTLTFYVGEQSVDFELVASHVYKPGAGSITFWVQMPPSALAHIDAPRYSMASLELGVEQFSLLGEMWQKHPSLRMTPLQEMTKRFDTTLAMVTQVISGFSILIITLAGIVILSSVHSLEAKEKKKNSVIMSFGFSRQTCFKLNLIEWSVTGSIAAIGAIVGTYIAGLLIYQSQFSLTYQPDFVWLAGTLSVILLVVTGFGAVASKNSLSSSIRELLAEN